MTWKNLSISTADKTNLTEFSVQMFESIMMRRNIFNFKNTAQNGQRFESIRPAIICSIIDYYHFLAFISEIPRLNNTHFFLSLSRLSFTYQPSSLGG